ncbi:MAG TPA: riboflavin biosynthesis protein RibF [Blastocatellia bacterium]|nr:riboflavin biosynthesis protein RibF [Blastocatellia bacterium]
MQVIRDLDDPLLKTPSILTFGVYDGLHLGHQLIMRRVAERAKATRLPATVLTFEPHPRAVLNPETAPPLLQTFEQKASTMNETGIDQLVVLPFTRELSMVKAEAFLMDIVFGALNAHEVYLGQGFAFGHNREGKFELLKQVARRLYRFAEEVPEVMLRGHRVSSTLVRRLVSAGRMNLARRMLGRPYEIEGCVMEGRRIGKAKLNYATANMRPLGSVIPATGVYITVTHFDGGRRPSISNIGHRPTFGGDPEVTLETHIFDFDGDLYDKRISVAFLHRLRGEQKFGSIDDLRLQIDRDTERAFKFFQKAPVRRHCDYV